MITVINRNFFAFLTSKVAVFTFPTTKAVYITSGTSVVSVGHKCPSMSDCNHEVADSRMVVHIKHALEQGMNTIEVSTVESHVVIILVGSFFEIAQAHPRAIHLGCFWNRKIF